MADSFKSLSINEQLQTLGVLKEIAIDNHKEHIAKYQREISGFNKLLKETEEDLQNLLHGEGAGLTRLYREKEKDLN